MFLELSIVYNSVFQHFTVNTLHITRKNFNHLTYGKFSFSLFSVGATQTRFNFYLPFTFFRNFFVLFTYFKIFVYLLCYYEYHVFDWNVGIYWKLSIMLFFATKIMFLIWNVQSRVNDKKGATMEKQRINLRDFSNLN